jgi:hypothetical protein
MEVDQIVLTLWEVDQALEREEAPNQESEWDQGLEPVQHVRKRLLELEKDFNAYFAGSDSGFDREGPVVSHTLRGDDSNGVVRR